MPRIPFGKQGVAFAGVDEPDAKCGAAFSTGAGEGVSRSDGTGTGDAGVSVSCGSGVVPAQPPGSRSNSAMQSASRIERLECFFIVEL